MRQRLSCGRYLVILKRKERRERKRGKGRRNIQMDHRFEGHFMQGWKLKLICLACESETPLDNDLQSKEKKSKKVSASNVQLPPSQLVRPQGGVETPKSLFSPINCISVPCKEEKREMNRQIESLKQEIDDLKSSLSKGPQSSSTVLTPSGEMDANEAAKKGLVPIAQGVYFCNVKVQALIHSVSSRTALACKMLDIFYPKDVLTGKRLKELDTRVVDAIADFALLATINEKDKNETEDDGKSNERKKITRGNVMQAMRQKCNQLIFQTKRPTYHKEKYEEAKKTKRGEQ